MSDEQKFKLLGEKSNLTYSLLNFLNDLEDNIIEEDNNIEDLNKNIIYHQLLNQSVTQSFNISNMKKLYLNLNLVFPFTETIDESLF